MKKTLIILFFLVPLLAVSQDKRKLDSLNKRYDSLLFVMKRPQMIDSMSVLNKLILLLQEVDAKRYKLSLKNK